MDIVSKLIWEGFSLGYGTFALSAFVALASIRKPKFRKLSQEDKERLATAREKLWSLEQHPFGLTHRFLRLRSGENLHYVESTDLRDTSNIVIFIHGYPDSYALWSHYLQSARLAANAKLIALDLPGFGGSDSFDRYGPEQVMEAVAEFIVKMRELHLSSDGRTVLVSHDWGALIAFRLASEAPDIADHFIMANCAHMPVSMANYRTRIASTRQMLRTWSLSPLNFRLLSRAVANVAPLIIQVVKSSYIFIFNLPMPMARSIGDLGDFFWFRYLNAVTTHPDPNDPIPGVRGAEMLAASIGPSARECKPSRDDVDMAYSQSVHDRAATGGFSDKIQLYRDHLAVGKWEKSLELLVDLNQIQEAGETVRSNSSSMLFDTSPRGSLKAPSTIIWGKGDVALDTNLALEGFRDFLPIKGSQIVQVSRCGHWSPLERNAIPIFELAIEHAVLGEAVTLKQKLGDDYPLATVTVEV